MKRIWAAGIMAIIISPPASAAYTPLYAGAQFDNDITTALLGYQIDKNWAVEAHANSFVTRIAQAGAINETRSSVRGLSALYMVPMKLSGGSPYFFFGKAGYERVNEDVSFRFPSSVTYSGSYSNRTNRGRFGVGAQYDIYKHLSGRAGVDVFGQSHSVYLSVILKF